MSPELLADGFPMSTKSTKSTKLTTTTTTMMMMTTMTATMTATMTTTMTMTMTTTVTTTTRTTTTKEEEDDEDQALATVRRRALNRTNVVSSVQCRTSTEQNSLRSFCSVDLALGRRLRAGEPREVTEPDRT